MNIEQLSIIELKALAYDQISKLEKAKQNLQVINQEIAKLEINEQQIIQDQPE